MAVITESKHDRRTMVVVAFLVAMVFTHVVLAGAVWPRLRNGYQDFTIFYGAGQMVRHGQSSSLYDLAQQYEAQQRFAPDVQIRHGALPYNHPPFEALLFVPLSFLHYLPAYLLWTVLDLLFLAVAVLQLQRHLPGLATPPKWLLFLAAAGFFPVAIALIQGQDSMLLLLIFVLALVALQRGRDAQAGVILALGLFKFHLVLPVVILLALRRWRIVLGFTPVAAVLTVLSVAMVGWGGAWNYIWFLLHVENSGAGGAIVPEDMPNLHGLLACFGGAGPPAVWLIAVVGIVIFCLTAIRIRRAGSPISTLFLLAITATVLISYHLLGYDLSLLLPAAMFLFVENDRLTSDRTRSAVLLLLFLTPLYVLLWFYLGRLGWYALVVLALFLVLYRRCSNRGDLLPQAS
jgi:hypothetical protein